MKIQHTKIMSEVHDKLFERAKKVIPGGVHSPVRSFKGLGMSPLFMKSADGAYLTDVTGKSYIDFCMSFGPLILGHKNEKVFKDVSQMLNTVWSFGTAEPYSLELAEYIIQRIPFIDQMRFVSSGTEAVMTALRLARGYTGKNKIIKFNGCYHGHVDQMLIKAGSGLAGSSQSSSLGVPKEVSNDTLIVELGDISKVKECIKNNPGKIAAIIVEPLPANNGLLTQDKKFLQALRYITKSENIILIFDEVISGFRASFGGMAERLEIYPDIVTYGKIIGGGMPVGAIGASSKIMQQLSPTGGVYQAGTLSANPLAMAAGLSTLKQLNENQYLNLEVMTLKIADILSNWLQKYNSGKFSHMKINTFASLFWITSDTDVSRACDIAQDINDSFAPMFKTLLNKGIYLSPNAYEVAFVSTAHNDSVLKDLENRLWN